jgi:SPP1 family predicted phage head-tail adaptor
MTALAFKLRHRVNIQRLDIFIDSNDGSQVEEWVNFAQNEPAEIYPLSGREFIAAQAVQAGISTRFILRWRNDLTESMRIVHEGKYYNIKSILPDPSLRRHLTILCDSGVNNG